MPPRPIAVCCLAESIGTFLLVFLGCGAVHVAVLTGDLMGLWQVGGVWGVAIMGAIYVGGAVSGAHINPAITVGLAQNGLFPWHRVAPYVGAQLGGAVVAAGLLFFIFEPLLVAKETQKHVARGKPGSEVTAMCYCEYYPSPGSLAAGSGPLDAAAYDQWKVGYPWPAAVCAEIIGTAILALVVAAVTDAGNRQNPGPLAPLFIGLTVTALICVFGPLTQACFNPARDLGPRLFAFAAGWGSVALPGKDSVGWFMVYIFAPLTGGVLGVKLYQTRLRPALASDADGPSA